MKTPCEIVVAKLLPNIRALVAIELDTNYDLRGKDIAQLVGTTEAAVSQYIHRVRGVHEDFVKTFPEITPFVEDVAKELYQRRESDFELTERIGDICTTLRKNEAFVEMFTQGKERVSCGICYSDSG